MDRITSRDNAIIRDIRRLLSSAAQRRESGRFVLEGARLCGEGARFARVQTVLYTRRATEQYPAEFCALRETGAALVEISEPLARYITDTETPQGLFCICERPESTKAPQWQPDGRYLALENVRDPGNLGTIIRTAEAFSLTALLLSAGCCDVYNPKVLRGSMGGALRLPIVSVGDMAELIGDWNRQGARTLACVADRSAAPLPAVSLGDGCVGVIGNEANGLTAETRAACTQCVTIPMAGRAESLNAAVAACIVMWELSK